jgi:hypothetical protein
MALVNLCRLQEIIVVNLISGYTTPCIKKAHTIAM